MTNYDSCHWLSNYAYFTTWFAHWLLLVCSFSLLLAISKISFNNAILRRGFFFSYCSTSMLYRHTPNAYAWTSASVDWAVTYSSNSYVEFLIFSLIDNRFLSHIIYPDYSFHPPYSNFFPTSPPLQIHSFLPLIRKHKNLLRDDSKIKFNRIKQKLSHQNSKKNKQTCPHVLSALTPERWETNLCHLSPLVPSIISYYRSPNKAQPSCRSMHINANTKGIIITPW